MKIKPFAVEEWMNRYEEGARYNIAETCVDSVSADELFRLCGEDREAFWDAFSRRRLTYGDIYGAEDFRNGVCGLYRSVLPDEVVTTHGASGANHHVFYSLVEPGDRVISIMPTYQQLYSIPEGFGADVHILQLRRENGYLPDLDELRSLAVPGTKVICINNPNNPAGSLMPAELLEQIVGIARSVGAYVLCDEVYRHLTQEDGWSESVADLYEKGISVGSMSKVFSLAGLRLGWITTHDRELLQSMLSHRDYNHISCGMFDEALASVALKHADILLERNRGIVRDNLAVLDEWIGKEEHFFYCKPRAGTTSLVCYDYDVPSYRFCEELYQRTGAFVTPGDCFEQPGCFRIGYACDIGTLKAGLAAISEYAGLLEGK